MSVYKVAQDVEADDKLLGPFSFRQFIYLIVVAMAAAIAWGLWGLFPPLAVIPLPIIVFFGALALPLRKDQPMETYLAAVVSFYLKPKKRLWEPDGIESLVEITAPKTVDERRTKDLRQDEAERRLSYLADIADTHGWSIRNTAAPSNSSSMVGDVYNEAQQTPDVLDEQSGVARSIDTMISQADSQRHQQLLEKMHQPPSSAPQTSPPPINDPYTSLTQSGAADDTAPLPTVQFNPYPQAMQQSVIAPLGSSGAANTSPAPQLATPQAPQSTSTKAISPDIINLANNTDLSVETIAHEAHRIQKKHDDEEVVISLR